MPSEHGWGVCGAIRISSAPARSSIGREAGQLPLEACPVLRFIGMCMLYGGLMFGRYSDAVKGSPTRRACVVSSTPTNSSRSLFTGAFKPIAFASRITAHTHRTATRKAVTKLSRAGHSPEPRPSLRRASPSPEMSGSSIGRPSRSWPSVEEMLSMVAHATA